MTLEGTTGTLGKGPVQKIGVRYVSLCFEPRCCQTSNAQGGWVTACDARGLMGFLACCLATLLAGCMATRVAASRLHGQLPGCLAGMGILIIIVFNSTAYWLPGCMAGWLAAWVRG